MRVFLMLASAVFLVASEPCNAGPEGRQIARSGESSVQATFGKRSILAKFHTFLAKKSDPWFPSDFEGYDELSFVQHISITVDDQALAVPRSAYTDLFNARAAAIRFEKGSFVLSIAGADGADAYQARIYFDSKQVTRRAVYDLEGSTGKPWQETRYAPLLIIN